MISKIIRFFITFSVALRGSKFRFDYKDCAIKHCVFRILLRFAKVHMVNQNVLINIYKSREIRQNQKKLILWHLNSLSPLKDYSFLF